MNIKYITWDDIRERVEWWSSLLKELKPWKKIQQKNHLGEWIDIDSKPSYDYLMDCTKENYRIIDRPTRPFKDIEEFKEHYERYGLLWRPEYEITLKLKKFDVNDKDFLPEKIEIYLGFIASCPKNKQLEMFHALYDNTLMCDAPFGVICKDGEISDSDNIPETPIKKFGELKEGDWIHVLVHLEWIDTYRYESARIKQIKNISKDIIEIFLDKNYRVYTRSMIKAHRRTSGRVIDTEGNHTALIFTNYFDLKRKFKELRS